MIKPRIPDHDVIAEFFFKAGKKGTMTFKGGKTLVQLNIPHEIYIYVTAQKEAEGLDEAAGPLSTTGHGREFELNMNADYTVHIFHSFKHMFTNWGSGCIKHS